MGEKQLVLEHKRARTKCLGGFSLALLAAQQWSWFPC